MIKGTVKFFNGTKGFGFITPDDGSKEVFVPTATVTSSGAGPLKAGQRVCFEAEQEARGPKAVRLKLLDEPLREIVRETVREAPRAALTLYYEADDEDAADVLAALTALGQPVRQVDYTLTPPSREDLKRLSAMLREANQSLARRYEPLFMELQLDDRFISETEFLTGIHEHPTLINGPILVAGAKARVCRTAEDVQAFLGNGTAEEKRSKGISARMAAMMLGHAVPPAPEKEARKAEIAAQLAVIEDEEEEEEEDMPAPAAKVKAAKPARKVVAVPVKKPAAKAPKPAPAAKAKAVKARAPAKPVKKAKK